MVAAILPRTSGGPSDMAKHSRAVAEALLLEALAFVFVALLIWVNEGDGKNTDPGHTAPDQSPGGSSNVEVRSSK